MNKHSPIHSNEASLDPMNKLLPIHPREALLDAESASLIQHIRRSLAIQSEMFRRILDAKPRPSVLLAELLEDTGNRYIDFSEHVSAATKGARED
jgi:hypothetical protein